MPRYIDADKLIEKYKGNILTAQTDYAEGCRDIIEDIKNAPAADVEEVKAHYEAHYTRKILKQHIQILGDDIEKIVNLYEHIKIELDALLEEEVKMDEDGENG